MFTGIVTDVGVVESVATLNEGIRLKIATNYDTSAIDIGASIACGGICLTVVELPNTDSNRDWFVVEAWEEAMRLTNLTQWKIGTHINLERSLKLGDEMGGHLVSGHVDGLAQIITMTAEGDAMRYQLEVPEDLARFIAQKGSVALNGTSLTVNSVNGNIFDVLIIKHTLDVTTWADAKVGDFVNVEIDQLARYAARLADFPIS